MVKCGTIDFKNEKLYFTKTAKKILGTNIWFDKIKSFTSAIIKT